MNPLVARIARVLGRGDDETREPAELSTDEVARAEDERRFDLDKAYWTRLEADREASPAFRQAMDDDPSFMYHDDPIGDAADGDGPAILAHPGYWAGMDAERATSPTAGAPDEEWLGWLTALEATRDTDEGRSVGDTRPLRDTGLER